MQILKRNALLVAHVVFFSFAKMKVLKLGKWEGNAAPSEATDLHAAVLAMDAL